MTTITYVGEGGDRLTDELFEVLADIAGGAL